MEFTRLADVTAVEEATDVANVLIEEGGEIKRVPKTAVGGASAGPVFTQVEVSTYVAQAEPTYVYDCSMSFEDMAVQYNEGTLMPATLSAIGTAGTECGIFYGQPTAVLAFDSAGDVLYPTMAEDPYAVAFVFTLIDTLFIYCLSDGTVTDQEPTFPDAGSGK